MSKISKTYKIGITVSNVASRAAKFMICIFGVLVLISLGGALVADIAKKH